MTHQEYKINGETVFSLVAEENEYIANHPDFRIRRPGLWPSSASVEYIEPKHNRKMVVGKCLRGAYYEALGTPLPKGKDVNLNMKGSLGKWDETGTIQKWKEMGLWVANNIKFFNRDLVLSGEMDAILRNPLTGGLMGTECKTYYGHYANMEICGAKGRRKDGSDSWPGRPKEDHFLQAILYYWEYRNRLDEYRLYYLERGDGHRLEFRVGFDELDDGTHQCWWQQIPGKYWSRYDEGKVYRPYTVEDIHDRYRKLIKLLKDKKLPPKDYEEVWDDSTVEFMKDIGEVSRTKYEKWVKNPKKNKLGAWQCSYCPYKDTCKQDSLTE